MEQTANRSSRIMVGLGRVLIGLSFLALFAGWLSELTGGPIFGFGEEHFFRDAVVTALLGLSCLADAAWHAKRV